MSHLLKINGAVLFLAAAFLNAFVDLGHKITLQNAIFKVYDGPTQVLLTAVVNSLILLPFIFLFVPAGSISDRCAKHKVLQISGWLAVACTLVITWAYHAGWFELAFAMTFLLAAQSAIYSPAKFAYLKLLFGVQRLAQANAVAQALVIAAILGGTFLFSFLFEQFYLSASTPGLAMQQVAPLGWFLVAGAILELACLYRLPALVDAADGAHDDQGGSLSSRLFQPIQSVLKRPALAQAMLGVGLFWGIGQVMLAAFPAFAEARTGVSNAAIVQGILAMSGIGTALGAMIAGRVSRDHIEAGLIPVAAAGIAISLVLIPLASSLWVLGALQLILGISGGMFLIPLNSLVQFYAGAGEIGRVMAVRNLCSNVFMLVFLLGAIVLSAAGLGEASLLWIVALVAAVGVLYTVHRLPHSLIRLVIMGVMTRRYDLSVQGLNHIPAKGGALLLGNHVSWIDWALIQIASPRPIRFVMARTYYDRWYLTWVLKRVGCIPIQQGRSSKESLKEIAEALAGGDLVCLFPEGALSVNGQLGEFRRGYETACEMTDADIPIIPFYLQGLWGSKMSLSSQGFKDMRKVRGRRDLVVTFGQALPADINTDVLKRKIAELSVSAWQEYAASLPSIASAWIDQVKQSPSREALVDDISGSLSARRALTGAVLMSQRIRTLFPERHVGLMLPFSVGGVLANMATLLAGKTLVNLNYTASADALQFACRETGITRIVTAKRFVTQLEKRGIVVEELLPDIEFIYLEDVRASFSKIQSLWALLKISVLPTPLLKRAICRDPNGGPAAVIFSSGSEGLPKGIVLSHTNMLSNLKQCADALQADRNDVMMGSLPLFHAFGLTVAQFLPLLEGVKIVCQPDPTDVLAVAKNVKRHKGTILVGTSTFLRFYCRNTRVHPLMLESLRLVVAGAEKLSEDVRSAFKEKFNKEIYEGYGMTECSPVTSVNLPDALDELRWKPKICNRPGSVGQPLPGTAISIVDPRTLAPCETGEEGMVMITGPQVMQGYLNDSDTTARVIHHLDGLRWYVTGDKGKLDKDGFLTLIDRYSRLAKLGGEMVSLGAVEQLVRPALIEQGYGGDIVATSVSDKRKGEKLVVLLDQEFDQKAAQQYLKKHKANPLMRPAEWLRVAEIPRLGAGKVDFNRAKKVAVEQLA